MKYNYEYEDSLVQRKKLVLIHILSILQKHTDAEHTLTVEQIKHRLELDYGIIVDRKAIKKNLMDLIAYAHTKEQAILKEDGKYEIFEAYAHGGFPILLELLEIDSTTELDAAKQEAILVRLASLLISNQIVVNDSLFI